MVISTLSMEQSYLRAERIRRRRDDNDPKQVSKDEVSSIIDTRYLSNNMNGSNCQAGRAFECTTTDKD